MGYLNEILVVPTKTILYQVGEFVLSMLLFIFILIIGWLISRFVVKIVMVKILQLFKVDDLSKRIELDELLKKGGIKYSLSELISGICYWLALLIVFVVALNAVGLGIAADLLQRVVLFVPNILAAIFILVIGMFAAVTLKNVVKTACGNAGISQSNLLSRITEIVIMVFAAAIALEQLQVGTRIVELTVTIVLGAFGLGFALAFGLGCKDMVGKSIAEFFDKLKK